MDPSVPSVGTDSIGASDWLVIAPVLLYLAGGAALLLLSDRRWQLPVALLPVLLGIGSGVALLRRVLVEGPLAMTMGGWPAPFGISFTADALGAGFALLTSVLALPVLLYARAEDEDQGGHFYPLVLILLAGVTGAFLTGDLFNLYVWFEVMLIASFGLMAGGGTPLRVDATFRYGVLNFVGTSIFLAALGLLYGLVGTLNMADVIGAATGANRGAMTAVAAMFLLAFGTKAAAVPMQSWLPASYHAPPAGVAALFAGLLTKVGVYALLRTLAGVLPESRDLLEPAIGTLAVLTLVVAPLGALAETDIRRFAGYLVIGGIGTALAGLALGGENGIAAAAAYAVQAMVGMGALFLLVGLAVRITGGSSTVAIGGLYAGAPLLSALVLVVLLTAAGIPPLPGFWPKLMLLGEGVAQVSGGGWMPVAIVIALLVNAFLTLVAVARLWAHAFWRSGPAGPQAELTDAALEPLRWRERVFALLPAALLALLLLATGIWSEPWLAWSRMAATELLAPARYITAVGLGGSA